MRIGIRYCGGCNPKYDRVKVVRFLEDCFSEIQWEYADSRSQYDVLLIVSGCEKECISQDSLQTYTGKNLHINGKESIKTVVRELRKMMCSC